MEYKTIAYHTVEFRGDENLNQVIKRDAPFKCCNPKAWLTSGYYFWDQDYNRALDWGKNSYSNRYVVVKCSLSLSNMLDLVGSRKHQQEFVELGKVVKEKFGKKDKKLPISKIITYLRMLEKDKRLDVFNYDAIKAQDHPRKNEYNFIDSNQITKMDLNPRIQICVFEKTSLNILRKEVVYICRG